MCRDFQNVVDRGMIMSFINKTDNITDKKFIIFFTRRRIRHYMFTVDLSFVNDIEYEYEHIKNAYITRARA